MKNLCRTSLLSNFLPLRRADSHMNKLWPRWSSWRRNIRKDWSHSHYQVETSSSLSRIWSLTNQKKSITSLNIFIRLFYSWLSDIQVPFTMHQPQIGLFNAWQVQFMKRLPPYLPRGFRMSLLLCLLIVERTFCLWLEKITINFMIPIEGPKKGRFRC